MIVRRGFTLLEIVIGLALSLMVILAVYAGIRTAVRSITAVERVALENKMLGFGLLAAVERADRWDELDDPYDSANQPLRTVPSKQYETLGVGSGGGYEGGDRMWLPYDSRGKDWAQIPQPFTPIRDSVDKLEETVLQSASAASYEPDSWLPHVPKSWYRGDHAWFGQWEKHDQSSFGNYGIFQAAGDEVQVIAGDASTTVALEAWRRWLPDQQLILSYGLGWYGWLDYLPANALIDLYVVDPDDRATRPPELRVQRSHDIKVSDSMLFSSAPDGDPDTALPWMIDWADSNRGYHGCFTKQSSRSKGSLYRTGAGQAITKGWETWTLAVGISADEPITNRSMAGQYYGKGFYSSGGHESLFALPMLLATLADEQGLIADNPDDWPVLSVDVRRYNTWGSPRTHCYVRFTDPISGESREIFFPVTATTLRGARLNRGLDRL